MNRIRKIYRTFIPFIIIFIGMLLIIFIMDGYAERLTRSPEVIVLNGSSQEENHDLFAWKTLNMEARIKQSEMASDSIFQLAFEAFGKKQYSSAEEHLTLLGSRYPQSPVVWNLLGMIEIKKRDLISAGRRFEKALQADETCLDARINLASVYSKIKRTADAKSLYIQALEMKPNDPEIHYNLGLLYKLEQNNQAAIDAFSNSIDLSSGKKRAMAHIQRGQAYLDNGDTLAARSDFNEAILLVPDMELARINYFRTLSSKQDQISELRKIYNLNNRSFFANFYLGNFYEAEGETTLAEFHYKKALEQDPSNEEVIDHLANLMIDQDRMREANLVIEGFIAGDTLPQAYFLKAKIAASTGEIESAKNLYDIAIERSNNNYPEAFVNLAILFKEQGNYSGAISNYKNAIESRNGYSLAWYNLALIYVETDSVEKAIEAYSKAIHFDPGSFKSWYNLGQLHKKNGQSDKEIAAYKEALEINPDYTRALLEMGNAYLNKEAYQNAIEAYEKILEVHPSYTKAWFNLGLAYSKMNDVKKSSQVYERLLELQPDHVSGRINLAIQYARSDKIELAISTLEDAVNIELDNPVIRYNLALQYEKLDMIEKAIYQFLKVIELDPGRASAYDQLLDIYSSSGDDANFEIIMFRKNRQFGADIDYYETGKQLHELEQYNYAIDAYKLARELGDDNRWIIYWIGKANMDLKKLETAIPYFEEVLEIDPEHKFSWYRLGQIYDMLDDEQKAEQYYQNLRRIDPDFKIVRRSPEYLEKE